MASIASLTLEVADVEAAERFYAAFGLHGRFHLRASEAPTTGFRGYTLALTVSQPADVDRLVDAALDAGAIRYLTKPVAVNELLAIVDDLLDRMDTGFS